jgi:phosphomannomutase
MKFSNPSIFKAYDIRGIYPSELNESSVSVIGKAIYTYLITKLKKESISVVLGYDMRASSESLAEQISDAILSLGGTVINIGLVPTPTLYYEVRNGRYDAGIQVSASHNPGEYNGIKSILRNGDAIIKIGKDTGMDIVKKLAISEEFSPAKTGGKVVVKTHALSEEVDAAYETVKPTIKPGLKVVVDAANAMGAPMIDELLKRTDINVIRMYWELDGTFPNHQADPLQFKLLKNLQKRVIEEGADFGIAPDGDGDRVFFVHEKGEIVPATLITALITKAILATHPGEKVLVDIRYIRNVQAVCNKYGGHMSVSRVGHALITEQLNREHAFFAGESSGHYYFRATGGGESSVRVILHLLHALTLAGKPLSDLLAEFATSVESGEINFELQEGTTTRSVIDTIKKEYKEGEFSDMDGIAITYPAWRFSIRSSNTEPLLRLNVEGESGELVKQKKTELSDKILSLGANAKE